VCPYRWCPRLSRCPHAGNPNRHERSFAPRLLPNPPHDTAHTPVQLTQMCRSSLVYVKAISAKVTVVHPNNLDLQKSLLVNSLPNLSLSFTAPMRRHDTHLPLLHNTPLSTTLEVGNIVVAVYIRSYASSII
jgi:hypothetical protein